MCIKFVRPGRVRYAVATGGDASWRLESRRRRSPGPHESPTLMLCSNCAVHSEELNARLRHRKRAPAGRIAVVIGRMRPKWNSVLIREFQTLFESPTARQVGARGRSADFQSAVSRIFNPQGSDRPTSVGIVRHLAEYNSACLPRCAWRRQAIRQIENLRSAARARAEKHRPAVAMTRRVKYPG